jgi:hypothetical protein
MKRIMSWLIVAAAQVPMRIALRFRGVRAVDDVI